jgi:phosphopantetheine adenylyltransferase
MGWDLGKELGQQNMETQLQRQVQTIFFYQNNQKVA